MKWKGFRPYANRWIEPALNSGQSFAVRPFFQAMRVVGAIEKNEIHKSDLKAEKFSDKKFIYLKFEIVFMKKQESLWDIG